MDLSALIFVALAVAWAVYLIPKALKHHDEVVRSRSVDRFSHTMRVLARREPVNRRNARLVVTPSRASAPPVVTTKSSSVAPEPAMPEPTTGRALSARAAVNRAARRRRRVLGLVLLANLAVIGVAAFRLIDWWYVAIPAGVLVAWLVACRLMVKGERRRWSSRATGGEQAVDSGRPAAGDAEAAAAAPDPFEDTAQTPAITDPSLWDPMPVTLPTYVTKPAAARRSVRTIDLDSTGVWTSGRTEADAQLAREAEEADRAARAQRQQPGEGNRAVGS